eukprot:m.105916 g.105916  ORF g.105916 m.105916 type:complete len:617 (-) comp12665_c0_seq4:4048-5898(-)
MKLLFVLLCCGFALSANATRKRTQAPASEFDVVVYESTPGGIMSAVAAGREGLSVALLSSTFHIGGMSSGGLGKSDIGNPVVIGGLAGEFFLRNGQYYGQSTPEYNLEPHVARNLFNDMLKSGNVTVFINKRIKDVVLNGTRIVSLIADDKSTFNAKVFVDASYEGDMMAFAAVPYTVGRESSKRYNESLAGFQGVAKGHEFGISVDPFDKDGHLLPLLSSQPQESVGDEDTHVQAYNFRLCLTQNTSNLVPFSKPKQYNADTWEVARRLFAKVAPSVPSGNLGPLPNGKYDMNNAGPISTDLIGGADGYPDGSTAAREVIWQNHKNYMEGLLWFFSQDPSLNVSVHEEMAKWGLCKDEFVETDNWPPQLYVREGRRMQGDFIFTQVYVEKMRNIDIEQESIGMGSYNYDMHNTQRYACTNKSTCTHFSAPYAWNEGDVETNPGYKYQIPVGVLFPPKKAVTNLLVPVAVSASHVGYGTLRMEPQFMIMGHSAGMLASVAIEEDVNVQDVNMSTVNKRLLATHQILTLTPPKPVSSNCTFEDNTHYNHPSNIQVDGDSAQGCCDACGGYEGCVGSLFRYADATTEDMLYKPSCWVMFGLQNKTTMTGVSACILNAQ